MKLKSVGKGILRVATSPFRAIANCIAEAREAAENERRRKDAPCVFTDGISKERFSDLAHEAAKETVRVSSIEITAMKVTLRVRSQSGLTVWNAVIDYSDYGHLTGRYWLRSENADSLIPEHYANVLKAKIEEQLHIQVDER